MDSQEYSVSLAAIEKIARVESAKMQHFYIGVEHLFIALTKLEGGLTVNILEQFDQYGRYLRKAIRDAAGKGDADRYWPGYRISPRAAKVMERAQELLSKGTETAEGALLMAILEEGDSLPTRVMQEVGIDLEALQRTLRDWTRDVVPQLPPPVIITNADTFSDEEKQILQSMFRKYHRLTVEHIFSDARSGATVIQVRPYHTDDRADAPVIVKLNNRQSILWEKQRYDFVKDTLPPRAAVIKDYVLSDRFQLGGLKYSFLKSDDNQVPTNLREFAATHDPAEVADLLREGLYKGFRETWWGQTKPYNFAAWMEYELLLPPALIVEALPGEVLPPTARTLQPRGEWSQGALLRPGEVVALESFTARRTKRAQGTLQLVMGAAPEAMNMAGRVDVHGIDLSQKSYYRGEAVPRLVGRVTQTRDDILREQVQSLAPDFDLLAERIPGGRAGPLMNPLRRYVHLLERRLVGKLSTIHGDLHTGNILIGPGGDAWLIDFEWTRDGHTLFDWAVLETSLLIDCISPIVGQSWDEVRMAITLLDTLNHEAYLREKTTLAHALLPIVEIRLIVAELLAKGNVWTEYYTALALAALRVLSWENRSLGERRLAFLVAALATEAAETLDGQGPNAHTDVSDLTTEQSPDNPTER